MPLREPYPSLKPPRVYRPSVGPAGGGIAVPVNITPPERDGIGGEDVGTTISCISNGTWENSPTSFEYEWHNGFGPIVGATNSFYVLTADDINSGIHCVVTAINAGGASLPAETETYMTAAARLINTAAPFAVDDNGGAAPANLTTNDGTWDSNPPNPTFAYEWKLNGGYFGGSNAATIAAADPGDYVCEVTASNGYATPSTASSNTVTLASSPP